MRNYSNDYLSEFEREFEMEFEGDTLAQELEQDSEYELNDSEIDSEFEFENYEFEDSDSEFEFDSENDLESRLYEVLNGEHESEFEFEQQLNEVMHEAERDFFWKKAFGKIKSFAKKLKNNRLVRQGISMALKATPMGAALSALPIGDIVKAASQMSRKGLRSGLMQLASNYTKNLPGGIGKMLTGAVQGETSNGVSRGQVRDFLNIAERAYENLADEMNKVDAARSPEQVQQILKNAPKAALANAVQDARTSRQTGRNRSGKRTIIPLSARAKVVVTKNRVIIIEP